MGRKAKFPRTCRYCGEKRPDKMTKDRSAPGGLSTICKKCSVKAATKYAKSEGGKYLRSLPRVKAQRAAATKRYYEKVVKPARMAAIEAERAAFEAKYPGTKWVKRHKPLECKVCGENNINKLALDEEKAHRRLCRECASGMARMAAMRKRLKEKSK